MAALGTATRGRRIALSALPVKGDREPVAYVCGAKPLPYGELTLTEGVEIPDAHTWTRLEAWVSARRVRPVYAGEGYTRFEDFLEAYITSQLPPVDTDPAEPPPAEPEIDPQATLKAKRQEAAARARAAKKAKREQSAKE